ncbi:Fe-S cluster assembly protein SufB [Candidatus Uhrbacteria bacterium]|nr:Fe-S cluster assembly protein SufB [Candidatus Uhrbacteria bacterium]
MRKASKAEISRSGLARELLKRDDVQPEYAAPPGLTRRLVRDISRKKGEPDWMTDRRLRGLELYLRTPLPDWGPDLSGLNLDDIVYYVRPKAGESQDWKSVPKEIRRTFDRLGIPESERHHLSGAGAQYDSEVVYHRLQEEWADRGVIFANMDEAVRKYPDLVRKHFMTECVPVSDHKFAMLHAAVWSGGTFIYIPPGVRLDLPLQAYFRMNAQKGGQFEHTLIIADRGSEVEYIEGCSAPRYDASSLHAGCVEIFVGEGATVRYSSIENWSRNTYNLNTKRALVDGHGRIEWLSGNFGSGRTMLYPMSVLRGRKASSEGLGVVFAGPGQVLDIGSKVIHAAPETSSVVNSRSISRGGGRAVFRGLVRAVGSADGSRSTVSCDALLLDGQSSAGAYPTVRAECPTVEIAHEATVGRLGEESLFYLMSRGLSEEEARKAMVSGFVRPFSRRLPLEYAVELERLLELEMERKVA